MQLRFLGDAAVRYVQRAVARDGPGACDARVQHVDDAPVPGTDAACDVEGSDLKYASRRDRCVAADGAAILRDGTAARDGGGGDSAGGEYVQQATIADQVALAVAPGSTSTMPPLSTVSPTTVSPAVTDTVSPAHHVEDYVGAAHAIGDEVESAARETLRRIELQIDRPASLDDVKNVAR